MCPLCQTACYMDSEDYCSRILLLVEYMDLEPIVVAVTEEESVDVRDGVSMSISEVESSGGGKRETNNIENSNENEFENESENENDNESRTGEERVDLEGQGQGHGTLERMTVVIKMETEGKHLIEEQGRGNNNYDDKIDPFSSSSSYSSSSPSSSSSSSSSSFCSSASIIPLPFLSLSQSQSQSQSLHTTTSPYLPLLKPSTSTSTSTSTSIPTPSHHVPSLLSIPATPSPSPPFSSSSQDTINIFPPGCGGHSYSGPGGHYLGACLCSPNGCHKSNNTFKKTNNNQNTFFHPSMPCGGTYVRGILCVVLFLTFYVFLYFFSSLFFFFLSFSFFHLDFLILISLSLFPLRFPFLLPSHLFPSSLFPCLLSSPLLLPSPNFFTNNKEVAH